MRDRRVRCGLRAWRGVGCGQRGRSGCARARRDRARRRAGGVRSRAPVRGAGRARAARRRCGPRNEDPDEEPPSLRRFARCCATRLARVARRTGHRYVERWHAHGTDALRARGTRRTHLFGARRAVGLLRPPARRRCRSRPDVLPRLARSVRVRIVGPLHRPRLALARGPRLRSRACGRLRRREPLRSVGIRGPPSDHGDRSAASVPRGARR